MSCCADGIQGLIHARPAFYHGTDPRLESTTVLLLSVYVVLSLWSASQSIIFSGDGCSLMFLSHLYVWPPYFLLRVLG